MRPLVLLFIFCSFSYIVCNSSPNITCSDYSTCNTCVNTAICGLYQLKISNPKVWCSQQQECVQNSQQCYNHSITWFGSQPVYENLTLYHTSNTTCPTTECMHFCNCLQNSFYHAKLFRECE